MKVKRRKYTPPEADLIRPAITGNIVALFDVRAHYDRLTQMYIDGFDVKLVSDTSYGSLWSVSFTLKEY